MRQAAQTGLICLAGSAIIKNRSIYKIGLLPKFSDSLIGTQNDMGSIINLPIQPTAENDRQRPPGTGAAS